MHNEFNHSYPHHMDPSCSQEVAMQRLWDRINAKFADREDVLKLANEVRRLSGRGQIAGVQQGVGGQTVAAGSDNIIHLKYEDWVESTALDASGQTVHVYNESNNALTAAAAAMVLKTIRSEASSGGAGVTTKPGYTGSQKVETLSIEICEASDDEGHPIVPEISYSKIYLTPARGRGGEDTCWNEWLAIPAPKNSGRVFDWECIGGKDLDLRWVKDNYRQVNMDIRRLEEKFAKFSRAMTDAILRRAVKPLEDLQRYLKSPEFIAALFEQLPRAAMGTDGLMTANSFAILTMLSVWASNDYRIAGGGALGANYVLECMRLNNYEGYEALKDKFANSEFIIPGN